MIPTLVAIPGAPWSVLPPGMHPATFVEVQTTFATNAKRRDLFDGLLDATSSLISAGCGLIYLDGSYVTGKPDPGDYDACWDPTGIDPAKLDPVFRDQSNKRQAQKVRFGGEFLPPVFLNLFQTEKFTGKRKGILRLLLSTASAVKRSSQS